MTFAAWIDGSRQDSWDARLRAHAQWLGLQLHTERHVLDSGATASFAWLLPAGAARLPSVRRSGDWLSVETSGESASAWPSPGADEAPSLTPCGVSSRVAVCLRSGRLLVQVPPATAEQVYVSRTRRERLVSNDLRLFTWASGETVDERAALALLQYRGIPAPLSFLRGVERVPGGHHAVIAADEDGISLRRDFRPTPVTDATPEDAAEQTRILLRKQLQDLPPDPVLFLSGGVDSALLAAELADAGRDDTLAMNYAFGADDAESEHAARVATHLGLRFERVDDTLDEVMTVVRRIGQEYTYPFSDRSVLPTNRLAHAALARLAPGGAAVDGTGADGAFGAWTFTTPLAAVPRPGRVALGAAYRTLRLWQRSGSVSERLLRAQQSLAMSLPHLLMIGEACLDGIAYTTPSSTRAELEEMYSAYVETLASELEPASAFVMLDLAHVCAGRDASKTYDPLRLRGTTTVYPFMEPSVVELALTTPYTVRCPGERSKALLKTNLARHLPAAWVEHPKSGFVPPFAAIMQRPDMQAFVQEMVLTDANPLLAVSDRHATRRVFDAVAAGQGRNGAVHTFVWTHVFTTAWWSQQPLHSVSAST